MLLLIIQGECYFLLSTLVFPKNPSTFSKFEVGSCPYTFPLTLSPPVKLNSSINLSRLRTAKKPIYSFWLLEDCFVGGFLALQRKQQQVRQLPTGCVLLIFIYRQCCVWKLLFCHGLSGAIAHRGVDNMHFHVWV